MNLSFVFPCLNEEETLRSCIRAVRESLNEIGKEFSYEIVVADNGSTDKSAEIAVEEGARVVAVENRGYGSALRGGIEASQGTYVMFADADMTYHYEDAAPLYETAIKFDSDMAIASRTTGTIQDGAMPTLHRYLGTPVLTGLINVLFRGNLSDCNSGFRCIRKTAFEAWGIRASGMEFASELLIKALKANAKMNEIPSGLRRGPDGRVAHLRTWRDGMRHLLFILSERPRLFEISGIALTAISSTLQLLALLCGPTSVAGLNIFDLHSKALLLLMGITGMQLYTFSCMLYLRKREEPTAMTRKIVNIGEAPLFFFLLSILVTEFLLVGGVVVNWALNNFANLDLTNVLVGGIHLLGLPMMLAVGLLGINVYKKSEI